MTVTGPPFPDLVCATPSGWGGPIVVASTPGTSESSYSIAFGSTVYVDGAWLNKGGSMPGPGGVPVQLRLNGSILPEFAYPPLSAGAFGTFADRSLGVLSPGLYTLELELDEGDDFVDEQCETNNVCSTVFEVLAAPQAGDCDGDADVDLEDYESFSACLAGPSTPAPGCSCVDFDSNSRVDLMDYSTLSVIFTGAPSGACCTSPSLGCVETTLAGCAASGGYFKGSGTSCTGGSCPAEYSNIIPTNDLYPPGAGRIVADDLTLVGDARELFLYRIFVAGTGGNAFNVNVALYSDCPGNGGAPISGTAFLVSGVPNDGFRYSISLPLASPIIVPDTIWVAASFSQSNAGWVIGNEAEIGSTADIFALNVPPWTCLAFFSGCEYAGLQAQAFCMEGSENGAAATGSTFEVIRAEPANSIEWCVIGTDALAN